MEHVAWSPAHIFIGSEGLYHVSAQRVSGKRRRSTGIPGGRMMNMPGSCPCAWTAVTFCTVLRYGGECTRVMYPNARCGIWTDGSLFPELQKSHETTLRFAEDFGMPEEAKELLKTQYPGHHPSDRADGTAKIVEYCAAFMEIPGLLSQQKSLPVEFAMAVRG